MTYDEITAKVNAYTLKEGVKVTFNFDSYGSTQVELRDSDRVLIWRAWSYETDFSFYLDRELDRYGVKKSDAQIAELEAAARAHRLRNDAIFCQDNGYEALFCSEFTREEIDAEIAVMDRELTAVAAYCDADPRRPSHVRRADYPTDLAYADAKVYFYATIIRSLWSERGRALYRRQLRKTIKSMRDWKTVVHKTREAEKYDDPGLLSGPMIRIKTHGGATYTALMSAVQIIPESGRVLAVWHYRHGLHVNPSFKTALNGDQVKGVEYAY